jgi:hypothetical protein
MWKVPPMERDCVIHNLKSGTFKAEEYFAFRPTLKVKEGPLSFVCECLFYTFITTEAINV